MNIINLRIHQVRRLQELPLERGILNTEALMLVLNKKQAKTASGGKMVFKYLDAQDDQKIMARKMYTTSMLSGSKEYKEIEELIIPDTVVVVDGKIAGFAMPLVENHKNLGSLINDDEIPLERKLPYLKQMGDIIDKVERVEKESFKMQFCDLNEYNFIIDKQDKVKAIDLDSAYVGQDEPSNSAYYLLKNKYLDKVKDKYKVLPNGTIMPNDDSDLYCYNMIVLDTLAKERMFKQDIETYYAYLNYLKDIGLNKDLVGVFSNIYVHKANVNPKNLIKKIDPSIEKEADFKVFKKEYNVN